MNEQIVNNMNLDGSTNQLLDNHHHYEIQNHDAPYDRYQQQQISGLTNGFHQSQVDLVTNPVGANNQLQNQDHWPPNGQSSGKATIQFREDQQQHQQRSNLSYQRSHYYMDTQHISSNVKGFNRQPSSGGYYGNYLNDSTCVARASSLLSYNPDSVSHHQDSHQLPTYQVAVQSIKPPQHSNIRHNYNHDEYNVCCYPPTQPISNHSITDIEHQQLQHSNLNVHLDHQLQSSTRETIDGVNPSRQMTSNHYQIYAGHQQHQPYQFQQRQQQIQQNADQLGRGYAYIGCCNQDTSNTLAGQHHNHTDSNISQPILATHYNQESAIKGNPAIFHYIPTTNIKSSTLLAEKSIECDNEISYNQQNAQHISDQRQTTTTTTTIDSINSSTVFNQQPRTFYTWPSTTAAIKFDCNSKQTNEQTLLATGSSSSKIQENIESFRDEQLNDLEKSQADGTISRLSTGKDREIICGLTKTKLNIPPKANVCLTKTDSNATNQQQTNRTNQCQVCGRNYARPSTLKTHLRTHTNERPFKCNVCCKTFSQAANLTAHQRVHTGERPFPCPICGRQFSQSSSVITHLRTHSGERPYKCSLCNRTFSDSSTLTKHCRIHSGEKPYQCHYCPLNFSQSGNLSRHLKLHLIGSIQTSCGSSSSSSSSSSSASSSSALSSSLSTSSSTSSSDGTIQS